MSECLGFGTLRSSRFTDSQDKLSTLAGAAREDMRGVTSGTRVRRPFPNEIT
jgi:hypothetical protein